MQWSLEQRANGHSLSSETRVLRILFLFPVLFPLRYLLASQMSFSDELVHRSYFLGPVKVHHNCPLENHSDEPEGSVQNAQVEISDLKVE